MKYCGGYSLPIVLAYFKDCGLPTPQTEYVFLPDRKFRFDFSWHSPGGIAPSKVALEVEGGIFRRGRGAHSSVSGILRDIEKYNLAVLNGWMVLRCTPANLCTLATVEMVKKLLHTNCK